MSYEIRKLAQELNSLKKQVHGLSTSSQLAHSSIENGSVDSYDEDGNLRLRIGDQGDGTQTIRVMDGPTPAAPSRPVVVVDGPVLTVTWNGDLADAEALPADFARIYVHLSETEEFEGDTARATIEAGTGTSTVTAVEKSGTWWVALSVEAQSGKRSELSEAVPVEVTLVGLDGALNAVKESADGKNTNFYNPVAPTPETHSLTIGDLWFDTSEDGQNKPHRWDGSQWVTVADARVTAVSEAVESVRVDMTTVTERVGGAESAAAQAVTQAQQAQQAASELSNRADSLEGALTGVTEQVGEKGKVVFSDTEPTDEDKRFILWIDTAGGNIPKRWDGSGWTTIQDKAVIDAAQSAAEARAEAEAALQKADEAHRKAGSAEALANEALSAATHGSQNLFSPSDPVGVAPKGALWFKHDAAGRIVGLWQQTAEGLGSRWESRELTDSVITNLDAGKITSGFIDAARIKAGSISADKLLIGDERNLIPNGDLSYGSALGWPSDVTFNADDAPPGLPASVSFPAARRTVPLDGFGVWRVEPGEELGFEVWLKADKPGSVTYIELRNQDDVLIRGWRNQDWSNRSYPVERLEVPTVWTRFRVSAVVPNGTTSMKLRVIYLNHSAGSTTDATVSVAGLKLYRKVASTVIADGAVTTEKLAAGSITAESGVIGSLDLGKATVGELDGARIKANTIGTDQLISGSVKATTLSADAINGKTITGATVQTSTGYPRVALDRQGFHAWDQAGRKTFDVDQNTGRVEAAGRFSSGIGTERSVIIDNALLPDGSAVFFRPKSGSTADPLALPRVGSFGDPNDPPETKNWNWQEGVELSAPHARGAEQASRVRAHGRGTYIGSSYVLDGRRVFSSLYETFLPAELGRPAVPIMKMGITSRDDTSYHNSSVSLGARQVSVEAAGDDFSGGFDVGQPWNGDVTTITAYGGNVALWSQSRTSTSRAAQLTLKLNGDVTLSGNRFDLASESANLGQHTYKNTGSNWGVRYYKGDDWFGEIGAPGGMFDANAFGVKSVGSHELEMSGQGASLRLRADATSPHLVSKTVYDRTYGSAANVYVTSYGTLGRSTSARKHKLQEQRIPVDSYEDRLLSIPFTSWIDKGDWERWELFKAHMAENPGCPVGPDLAECPQDEPRRAIGAVAEDFVEAGLPEFVTFDEMGEPDGLQYDRIGPALIPVVARLRDRIEELERKL